MANATGGLACDRMTQPCPQDDCCMLQEGNLRNQVCSSQTTPRPISRRQDAQFAFHLPVVEAARRVQFVVQNIRLAEHTRFPQELRAEDMHHHVSSALLPETGFRRRVACSAARHSHQRVFACLASIALANAPDSNLRFSGSAYLANAPLALSCLGNVIAIGMECVKTHCRAKMRSASANDVPSSRNSCSASCLSAEFIRNCITVDFVASMSNPFLCDPAYNYTTNVLQMQGGIERQETKCLHYITTAYVLSMKVEAA